MTPNHRTDAVQTPHLSDRPRGDYGTCARCLLPDGNHRPHCPSNERTAP